MTHLDKANLFEGAIQYLFHCVTQPETTPPQEGYSEYHPDKKGIGTMWVYDGRTVLQRAIEAPVVLKPSTGIRETIPVPTLEGLVDLVYHQPDKDSVYFINTEDQEACRVKGNLRNYHAGVNIEDLTAQLPYDFLSTDGRVPIEDAGGRTDAAMLTAYILNTPEVGDGSEVRVLAVKETKYGPTNYGKIVEFGPGGRLLREFFLLEDSPRHLCGVYREYSPEGKHTHQSLVFPEPSGGLRYSTPLNSPHYSTPPSRPHYSTPLTPSPHLTASAHAA